MLAFVTTLWCATAHAQLAPVQRAGLSNIDHMLLDRELTLDDDIVELGGRLQTIQIDFGFASVSVTALIATVGYGIGDVVEIWAEPVLFIDPETELGLNIGLSLRAVNGETFDMAPSLAIPMNLTADGDTISSLTLGLDSRVRLGSVVSLFLLHGLVTPVFVADTVIIAANVGLGFQIVDIFGLRLETRPFALETAEGEVVHYGDVVPFGIDAVIDAGKVDCFLGMAFPDLGNAGDLYMFTIGAMGRL